MAPTELQEATQTHLLRKNGAVVGLLDHAYEIDGKPEVRFERIQVRGDLSGELEYAGQRLVVEDFVGLEITRRGVEGPLWIGAVCRVLPS